MARGPGKRRSASRKSRAAGRTGLGEAVRGIGSGGSAHTLPVVAAVAAFLVGVAILPYLMGPFRGLLPDSPLIQAFLDPERAVLDSEGNPLGRGRNPLGPAGHAVQSALKAAFGAGSAAVPLCLLAGAAALGKWWSPETLKRAWILAGGLLFLLPATAYVWPLSNTCTAVQSSHWTGFLGAHAIGRPLCSVVGWFGTAFVTGTGWVAVCAAVFGFNPLTLVGTGVVGTARRAGRGFASVAERAASGGRALRQWAKEHRKAAAERRTALRKAAREAAKQVAREAAEQQAAREAAEEAARETAREAAREAAVHPEQGAALPEAHPGDDAPWEAPPGQYVPTTGTLVSPEEAGVDPLADTGRSAGTDEPPQRPAGPQPTGRPRADAGSSRGPGSADAMSSVAPGPADAESSPAPGPADADDPSDAVQPWPSLELLAPPEHRDRLGMERELDRLGEVLIETLRTFNIKSTIGGRTTGPAVTQFEVVPAAGVKVNRIANLDADLALAMKARSVRIVAPIPGKGAVGVEIPNPEPEMVRLREILGSAAFARSSAALPLALGKDLTGRSYVTDLTKMPHALIAGATGSGKSVCLNTIITSLVYRNGPDQLRLLLIDPKMVELSAYSDLPHLRHPVVTDPKDAAGVLKWAVLEMERRYALLSANGVRSLKEFNTRVENEVPLRRPEPGGPEGDEDRWVYKDGPLPYVVVVVDELADLMMQVQADVEKPLAQLAQKARAIGIHLLVATQRPTVNVVTGLIKANFPCRIAFRVASKTDSRTILDQNGADSLLGHGDMLFLPPGQSSLVRMQGAFISTEDTEALMGWFREQAGTLEAIKARVTRSEDDILETLRAAEGTDDEDEGAIVGDWDDLFREAAEACIQQGGGSTSLLQRRLRIGYGRAARIVDQLHDAGVLGPPDGSRPREVLVGPEGLDEICPS